MRGVMVKQIGVIVVVDNLIANDRLKSVSIEEERVISSITDRKISKKKNRIKRYTFFSVSRFKQIISINN